MSWKTNYVYYNMIIQQQSALILEWPKEKKEKKNQKKTRTADNHFICGPPIFNVFLISGLFFWCSSLLNAYLLTAAHFTGYICDKRVVERYNTHFREYLNLHLTFMIFYDLLKELGK